MVKSLPCELPPTNQWLNLVEGGVLCLAFPLLLFPTAYYPATLAVLLLLVMGWLARWMIGRETFAVSPFNGALLIWQIAVGTGILVTALPELTLPKATGLILGLAVWRYMGLAIRSPRALSWALGLLLLVGAGLIMLGILSTNWPAKVPLLTGLLRYVPPQLINLPDSPSSGVHANQLAGIVVFFWAMNFSFLLGTAPQREHKVRYGGLLMVFGGLTGILLLSQSRSGWIGALGSAWIALAGWSGFLPHSHWRTVLRVLLVSSLCLGLVGVLWAGPERLQRLWDEPSGMAALGGLNTMTFRFEVWRWALAATQDFLFTGCGLGTFRQVVRLLYPLNVPPGYDIAHAHNIFLQVAVDVGVPGLIAYLALLGLAGMTGGQIARRAPRYRPLALSLLSGLIALHIYGLTDALAPGSKPAVIFWGALGLLAALDSLVAAEKQEQEQEQELAI